nr:RNA-directed DNA polymerase, eukaryota [Tanacetum cinerariifolium]
MLWPYLNHMIDRWDGESILMGDFNKVRHKEERFGSIFNNHNAMVFNSFISSSGLVEVPLKGCAFTWCHKSGSKMSKLDRFLISEGIMGFCQNITSVTLDRYLSDHRPILLRELEATEIAQKAKIKWSIEGDENSKLFHGILNKKRNQHAIRGILSEGNWIEDPNSVKNAFFSHFKERFDSLCSSRLMLEGEFLNKLRANQSIDLESNVMIKEIKRAVWDCGIDKSPGPDGFTFGFYKRYWDIIKKDVADAVSFFFISDGPFILDELIHWCHAKKKETMIFKVNFKKAYDSVKWDYLDDVLNKFGFGSNWRNWIHNCLNSSKGSILVNGIPTGEFQFQKDLKQGDPLSLFLFLLIIESLHLSYQNLVNEGLFKGVSVSSSLHLSHLFYADDVIFMGQWSVSNINTLVQALDCFYKASGLRMNLQKSKLMGISVEDEIVSRAVSKMWCCTLTTPFLYLGVKVGGSMSRIKAWDEIEAKLHSRLSKWKMKTLSSGVRLTLLKSVLGSFIRAVHGNSEGIKTHSRVSYSSTSLSIVNEVNKMSNKCIDLLKYMKIQVGNGLNTKFWEDIWMGNKNFKTSFPRIYALESYTNLIVADKMAHNDTAFSLLRQPRDGVEMEQFRVLSIVIEGVLLHDMVDRWKWTLEGSGKFYVASARKFIDNSRLIGSPKKNRWIKMVPIKVNILAWKVQFDLLHTRLNLSRKEWLAWFCSFKISSKHEELLEGIYYAMWCVVIKAKLDLVGYS